MIRRATLLAVSLCILLLFGCEQASLKVDQDPVLDGDSTSECLEDSDCRDGEHCVEERCWPLCESDEDCSNGMVCMLDSGTCQFPLSEDGDDVPDDSDGDEDGDTDLDGPCEQGQLRCCDEDDQIIEECRNGSWELLRFCQGANEVCQDARCVELELDGDDEPDGDEDGDLEPDEEEVNPEEEEEDAEAEEEFEAECIDEQRRCGEGREIEQCRNGRWDYFGICPEGWLCEEGYCLEIPADGDVEDEVDEEPPCRCEAGPCCDGCDYLPAGTPCDELDPLLTCNGSTDCGSDLYMFRQTRLCAGGTSACNGGIQTGPLELHTDCSSGERCHRDGATSGSCQADVACQCECSEGACCDGCHFKPEGILCNNEVQTERRCESVNVNDPNDLCGARPQHRTQVQYCAGDEALCTGSTQWLSWEYDTQSCQAEQRCDVDADEVCTTDATCTRQCTEGPCCDTTTYSFKLPGTVCLTDVEVEFGCPDADYCGGDYKRRTKNQVCTGFDSACNGGLVAGEWQLVADCPGNQSCGENGCQDDAACACECDDGVCCDGCYLLYGDTVCDSDLGEEFGCPWGETAGADVGRRTRVRYCSGDSTDCTGNPGWTAWSHYQDCADWQTCRDNKCVNLAPCSSNEDCSGYGDFYCRQGDCIAHETPCNGPDDCAENTFCNTAYGECLPTTVACVSDTDCQGYNHYNNCDEAYGFCYDPDCFEQDGMRYCCDPQRNNCRPGTSCNELHLTWYPDGYYCQGCDNGQSCYSDWECKWLIGQGNFCQP